MNPLNATIRKARAEDASAAWDIRNAAILHQCTGHYPTELLDVWTSGEITGEFIRFVAEHLYVAALDDVVAATGMVDCRTGHVDGIFVRPDMMGKGIGRQMLTFLEEAGRAAGLTRLTLDSTLNAAPFYRRCGFVGEALGVYRSPRGITLDCVPMTKVLASPPDTG